MASEAVVVGSLGGRVRLGTAVLASVSVTCEVIVSGPPGETVTLGTAELASVPRPVTGAGVLSNMLWGKLGIVLDAVGLVSAGWVTGKTVVVSGSLEECVRVGTAELLSVP